MKLSTRSRYGMRAVFDLAKAYGDGPLQIKSIAKTEDISNKYLEQLISILKSAGLVRSVRGPKGGYYLSRPPEKINLSEVFRVLEGPFLPVDCLVESDYCGKCSDCMMKMVWTKLQNSVDEVLGAITLADLVKLSENGGVSCNYQI